MLGELEKLLQNKYLRKERRVITEVLVTQKVIITHESGDDLERALKIVARNLSMGRLVDWSGMPDIPIEIIRTLHDQRP